MVIASLSVLVDLVLDKVYRIAECWLNETAAAAKEGGIVKVSNQNLRISLPETSSLGKSIEGEIFKFREI